MIHELDPALAITDVRTMRERFDLAVGAPRFRSALFAAFGVLALLLAAVGLYAVTATIVAERTREIGVRMVLGAQARNVVGEVLLGALRTASLGLVIGGVIATLAMQLLQGLLFGLSPLDPRNLSRGGGGPAHNLRIGRVGPGAPRGPGGSDAGVAGRVS
jgi:ABC-type antimicrobial peptide transport system permease subunit